VTYAPNSIVHLTRDDLPELTCVRCASACSEQAPCNCCRPTVVPEVRFVSDGDSGMAGESHGG
jgi:hypothetical protein